MPVIFPFEKILSDIFGEIFRPYATVLLQKKDGGGWIETRMVVDTGADYTLLPKMYARRLGIDIFTDCDVQETHGVGGAETIYLYRGLTARIGNYEQVIPVGFLERSDVPPLLGRQEFLETFRVVFEKRKVSFSKPRIRKSKARSR